MKVEVTAVPAAGSEVKSGDTIEYTVTVTNDEASTETLMGMTATETPPAGTTYVPPDGTASPAAASRTDLEAASAPEGTVVITDPTELVNHIWWLVANSDDPTEYMEQALGTVLAVDDQMDGGNAPHSILLAVMSEKQLLAFRLTHPEASQIIDATLAMYDEIRPLVLYMIGHHQVSLGLANASEVPYLLGSDVVLRGPLAEEAENATSALDPSAASAAATAESAQSVDSVALVDLAPGESATAVFRVTVGPTASGQLTNTVTVSATNHPTVVATTTHMGPTASGDDEDGDGDGDGRAFGDDGSGGGSGTTTTLDGSSATGGEALAFTGLDVAKLVLLAMSLLLAGWVLLSRGRIMQQRAAVFSGRQPVYEVPTGRFAPRTWFFLPTRD
jgi:uncharacterized repeat protein (TIGR01451 family)